MAVPAMGAGMGAGMAMPQVVSLPKQAAGRVILYDGELS